MPTPLIAKGSTKLSPIGQAVAVIFIGGPLAALWYCLKYDLVIHFDNPWLNLGVHAALFVFPLFWVGLMFAKPVVYEAPKDHTVIATSTFFQRQRLGWWGMFVLWATPVAGIIILGQILLTLDQLHLEMLSTSAGKAVAIVAIVFCLGVFYWTMLSGRDQPAVWISDEGLRTGILRFHEWKDIHHVSRDGNVYSMYNRVNPAIPAKVFEVQAPEARALLERHLAAHQIRIHDDPSPLFMALKVGVLLSFIANIVFSLWLYFYRSFSPISVVLISFAAGIVLTLIFEKFRGVWKFGKVKPVVQFDSDDDEGEDVTKTTV
jgi:hypothetical protein